MKVILTQRVNSLGNVGEIVNVSPGYARNFLIPKSFAVFADEKNKREVENYKRKLSKAIEVEKKAAEELAKKIKGMTIEFTKRITGNGTLFGSITAVDVAKALEGQELGVEKRQVIIASPIKTLGTFEIKAKLFKDVEADFNVKVVIDPVQAEEIKKREEAALKKKKEAQSKKAEAKEEGAEEASADAQADEAATEENTDA